ncbi:MAG: EamA family transporter [Clostridiales bacterium]|nr:EamA family transporter [Clostridiales bacterium]
MSYYMPIVILVFSNVMYQICSKNVPHTINPLAMLTITYVISAGLCVILYYVMRQGSGLLSEYQSFNAVGVLMAVSLVGMEIGAIYMYKVGWPISIGFMFNSTIVAFCLVLIGVLVYREEMNLTKLAGIATCLCGIYLINK